MMLYAGLLNLTLWTLMVCLSRIVNNMAADVLAMQWARASSTMVLTMQDYIPFSAAERLTCLGLIKVADNLQMAF